MKVTTKRLIAVTAEYVFGLLSREHARMVRNCSDCIAIHPAKCTGHRQEYEDIMAFHKLLPKAPEPHYRGGDSDGSSPSIYHPGTKIRKSYYKPTGRPRGRPKGWRKRPVGRSTKSRL